MSRGEAHLQSPEGGPLPIVERVIQALVEAADFFPGDAEDCARAMLPLLSEAWREGYDACEAWHWNAATVPNPYLQSTEGGA